MTSRQATTRQWPCMARLMAGAVALMFFAGNNAWKGEADTAIYIGERILYLISPLGRAEYHDLGIVDDKGKKVNLVTFKTNVLLVEDAQKIYSDPESLLPVRGERTISRLWMKEYITQDYDQEKFTVVIRKFKGGKCVDEQTVKADGPIQDIILLPFYLRRRSDLDVGLHVTARVPAELRFELVSIDDITVPAGKFRAYHFKSVPDKFEIWINKDTPRVPLKIQGRGIIDYALLMKKYSLLDHECLKRGTSQREIPAKCS